MAKAIAQCTCRTCGKTFEVTAFKQNSREARRFEEWAESSITECRECEDKRIAEARAQENAEALESARQNGWPELTGSAKQVAWATAIRKKEIESLRARSWHEKHAPLAAEAIDYIIREKTTAAWWIDNQGMPLLRLIADLVKNPEQMAADQTEAQLASEAAAETEAIAEPQERRHDGIVDIRAADDRVSAAYRKDDSFRELVKALGYRWNAAESVWFLTIGSKTGTAADRAAELGSRLLNAGFAVRIQDAETLRRAVAGEYEPTTSRWVARIAGTNDFIITWGREDSYYDQAKRLPGARYDRPGIRVPGREYEAVLDFADTCGFRLTQGANALVDELNAATRVVAPAPVKEPTYDEHPVADILNSSREVLEDLKEDI